jgi:hypothetical protein
MLTWIVDLQPALRLGLTGEEIVQAIRAEGQEAVETVYDPSNGLIPDDLAALFESRRPIVLRGSVAFANWAHSKWAIVPGAFRSDMLRQSVWMAKYGDLALNHDAVIATYSEFVTRRQEYEIRFGGALFVKPADGGKLLSGTVLNPEELLSDVHYSRYRRWSDLPDDFRLLVSAARPIEAEWRFVIAGEHVAGATQYRRNNWLNLSPGAPSGAAQVAKAVAEHSWRPADVFVADVALTDGNYRLLELNTFGTAGLYQCDLAEIVRTVSHQIASTHSV